MTFQCFGEVSSFGSSPAALSQALKVCAFAASLDSPNERFFSVLRFHVVSQPRSTTREVSRLGRPAEIALRTIDPRDVAVPIFEQAESLCYLVLDVSRQIQEMVDQLALEPTIRVLLPPTEDVLLQLHTILSRIPN